MPTMGSGREPQCDVIVLGAGVVGIATAYALAQRGISVTLIDKANGPARGTSLANGAQLSYINSDALASLSTLRRLPFLAAGLDSTFRLIATADPEFLTWGIRFLANCTGAAFRRNTLNVLQLGLESRLEMHRVIDQHQIRFGHAAAGKMHLYYGFSAFRSARNVMLLKRVHGANQTALTPSEAVSIEPSLAQLQKRLIGAIYSPEEDVGDAHLFSSELLRILVDKYRVQTRFGFSVTGIEIGKRVCVRDERGNEMIGDRLVVCAGAEAARVLRLVGIQTHIWPMKGYSFTAPLGAAFPVISLTDTMGRFVICRLSGRIRVAGLAELGARSSTVDQERLGELIAAVRAILPDAADYDSIEHHWAGLRAMSPSSAPIIEQRSHHVFVNIGHGMLGWTLALGSAQRLAHLFFRDSNQIAHSR